MNEREKLKQEVSELVSTLDADWSDAVERISDFIINDRKRIVEPGLTWDRHMNTGEEIVNKIIKNAGLGTT